MKVKTGRCIVIVHQAFHHFQITDPSFCQVSQRLKSLSCVRLFATPWTVAYQALPSLGFSMQEYWSGLPFPSPWDLPYPGIKPRSPALQADFFAFFFRFFSIIGFSNKILKKVPHAPPTFSLSQHQGLFKWVCFWHQVAKVLQFQLQHQSFNYSGLISFRMDWLDLLAAQETLNSLLQQHSSKASIL